MAKEQRRESDQTTNHSFSRLRSFSSSRTRFGLFIRKHPGSHPSAAAPPPDDSSPRSVDRPTKRLAGHQHHHLRPFFSFASYALIDEGNELTLSTLVLNKRSGRNVARSPCCPWYEFEFEPTPSFPCPRRWMPCVPFLSLVSPHASEQMLANY